MHRSRIATVIPAKAGIHGKVQDRAKGNPAYSTPTRPVLLTPCRHRLDSRFRGNDGATRAGSPAARRVWRGDAGRIPAARRVWRRLCRGNPKTGLKNFPAIP